MSGEENVLMSSGDEDKEVMVPSPSNDYRPRGALGRSGGREPSTSPFAQHRANLYRRRKAAAAGAGSSSREREDGEEDIDDSNFGVNRGGPSLQPRVLGVPTGSNGERRSKFGQQRAQDPQQRQQSYEGLMPTPSNAEGESDDSSTPLRGQDGGAGRRRESQFSKDLERFRNTEQGSGGTRASVPPRTMNPEDLAKQRSPGPNYSKVSGRDNLAHDNHHNHHRHHEEEDDLYQDYDFDRHEIGRESSRSKSQSQTANPARNVSSARFMPPRQEQEHVFDPYQEEDEEPVEEETAADDDQRTREEEDHARDEVQRRVEEQMLAAAERSGWRDRESRGRESHRRQDEEEEGEELERSRAELMMMVKKETPEEAAVRMLSKMQTQCDSSVRTIHGKATDLKGERNTWKERCLMLEQVNSNLKRSVMEAQEAALRIQEQSQRLIDEQEKRIQVLQDRLQETERRLTRELDTQINTAREYNNNNNSSQTPLRSSRGAATAHFDPAPTTSARGDRAPTPRDSSPTATYGGQMLQRRVASSSGRVPSRRGGTPRVSALSDDLHGGGRGSPVQQRSASNGRKTGSSAAANRTSSRSRAPLPLSARSRSTATTASTKSSTARSPSATKRGAPASASTLGTKKASPAVSVKKAPPPVTATKKKPVGPTTVVAPKRASAGKTKTVNEVNPSSSSQPASARSAKPSSSPHSAVTSSSGLPPTSPGGPSTGVNAAATPSSARKKSLQALSPRRTSKRTAVAGTDAAAPRVPPIGNFVAPTKQSIVKPLPGTTTTATAGSPPHHQKQSAVTPKRTPSSKLVAGGGMVGASTFNTPGSAGSKKLGSLFGPSPSTTVKPLPQSPQREEEGADYDEDDDVSLSVGLIGGGNGSPTEADDVDGGMFHSGGDYQLQEDALWSDNDEDVENAELLRQLETTPKPPIGAGKKKSMQSSVSAPSPQSATKQRRKTEAPSPTASKKSSAVTDRELAKLMEEDEKRAAEANKAFDEVLSVMNSDVASSSTPGKKRKFKWS